MSILCNLKKLVCGIELFHEDGAISMPVSGVFAMSNFCRRISKNSGEMMFLILWDGTVRRIV